MHLERFYIYILKDNTAPAAALYAGEGGLIIVYLIAVVVIRELHSAVGIMRRGIDEGIFKLRLREENVCQRRGRIHEDRRASLCDASAEDRGL